MNEPTHEDRLRVARQVALWRIGDPSWADVILEAYLHPVEAAAALDRERRAES